MYTLDGAQRQAHERPNNFDLLWADLGPGDEDRAEYLMRHLYPAHPAEIARVLEQAHPRLPNMLVQEEAVVFTVANFEHLRQETDRIEIGVVLGHRFLMTAHWHQAEEPTVDKAWTYVAHNQLLDQGVDFALYQLLSHHIDHHQALVGFLNRRFEAIQEAMLEHPYRNLAPAILELRRQVVQARRITAPEVEIFNLMHSSDFVYVSKKNRPYYQDLSAHMTDISSDIESNRDGLSGTVEAYTSMQSNEINKVMKFLTIISLLSLPATTIASIYGTNFYIPEIHWPYGYYYSLVLMGLVTMALLGYMRRRKWLTGRFNQDHNGED